MRSGRRKLSHKVHLVYGLVVIIAVGIAFFILHNLKASNASQLSDSSATPVIDSLHHIPVYYNGDVDHVAGRSVARNGYNYGLKWQCVEFVKRYYADHLGHYMPDADGNAKDLFDKRLPDASFNEARALVQYANPSLKKPQPDDIIVFDGHLGNRYGHVAIISQVTETSIEIIQQNAGPDTPTREWLSLEKVDNRWEVDHKHVLGWLRVE
ncbi:MAG TPA: CHAP domain-containing protein [Chitinophagales bacterium]|nr:CHAP domain-containing protein [Chitinophagales bacterium]